MANLGLATTRELLDELRTRIEMDGKLDYRTVDIDEDVTGEGGAEVIQPERVLPEGKRVVRTKTSQDRVYLLDDATMKRHWATKPGVVEGLGFKMEDVVEVTDDELFKYQTGNAIYRVEDGSQL